MLQLLLDEMISPLIVKKLWDHEVDAVPVRDRQLLGRPDHVVWRVAQSERRAVVTINHGHFITMAAVQRDHMGLVLVPAGATRSEQFSHILSAVTLVRQSNDPDADFCGRIIEVEPNGQAIMCVSAWSVDAPSPGQ